MARQDDNQFEDAMEDAESDLMTSSDIMTSKSINQDTSGYLNDIDAPSLAKTNGELPESENQDVNGGNDVVNNYSEDDNYSDNREDDYQGDYNGANGYANDGQYNHEEETESDRAYQDDPQLDDETGNQYQGQHPREEIEDSNQDAEEDYRPQEYNTQLENNNEDYFQDDIEDDKHYKLDQLDYTESDLPDSQAISNSNSDSNEAGADVEYNPAAQDDFEEDSYQDQDEPDQWLECDSVDLTTTPGGNPTHIEDTSSHQIREPGENDSVEADQEEPLSGSQNSSEPKEFYQSEANVDIKPEPIVIEKPSILDQDDIINNEPGDDKDIEDKFIDHDTEDKFIDDTEDRFIDDTEDKFIDETEDKFIDETEDKFIDMEDINDIKEPDIPNHEDKFKAITPDSSFKPISIAHETKLIPDTRTQFDPLERKEVKKPPQSLSSNMPNSTRRNQDQSHSGVSMQKATTPTSPVKRKAMRQAPGAATRAPLQTSQTRSPQQPGAPLTERRTLSQNPAQNIDSSLMGRDKSDRWQDGEQMKAKADGPRMKPAPGSAKPVASLKSRLQSERQAMLELEKTLAVTAQSNVQQQARRTQNATRRPVATDQKTSPVSARHNDEYASVSSLRKGQDNHQASPTVNKSKAIHNNQQRSQRPSQRSPQGGRSTTKPSTSPTKRGPARSQPTRQEQARNNSNANHLQNRLDHSKSNSVPSALTQGSSANNKYGPDVQETQSNASGEVVFDDCAECGAYLEDKIMNYQDAPVHNEREKYGGSHARDYRAPAKQPIRRRNSYELANRMSSSEEEDDDINGLFTPSSHLSHRKEDLSSLATNGKYDNGDHKGGSSSSGDDRPTIPPTGVDDTLLAKLAERELANLWKSHERLKPSESTDSGIRQDSSRQSTASDLSSPPMTPGEHNNRPEPRKVLPNISPMEYDVIGLRLAGHSATINESSMNLSSNPPQPEEDQFSDAEENDAPVATNSNPNGSSDQYVDGNSTYSGSSLDYGTETPDSGTYSGRNLPRANNHDQGPQVNIKETMKELQDALSTSKSALMKTPSFYVQEAPPEPIWILQPNQVKKMADDARKARITEERKKRQDELRQIRQQQRAEIMQSTNPQCYQREEDDDDDGLENRQLMSDREGPGSPAYTNRQRPLEPDTMRYYRDGPEESLYQEDDMEAPDLPPATGKIKEALSKGILYPAAYLGSTQLVTTKQPTKKVRMQQAQEAVNRIKSPDGEDQPSTEVDLAISNERIRVLNADTQETMMDHPLKSISYIADIGNIVVIMARRRTVTRTLDEAVEDSGVSMDAEGRRQPRKIICHVFETEDAQLIAQTIGQAFALAYLEFLKANGIEDPHVFEMDYHDVLNSQEIYGDDLMLFSNKECEKEVLVEKERGEIMGMVIVESGWGSLVPTVVIANMSPFGAAARSGKLNIGDQIMSINGTSLVGLPLAQCQQIIKSLKSQCLCKFNMVSCPPVTQVLIKRPDTKYQLGFSVQNGIICSLMRGGIAERGGVRVGHRIIEINGTSVVATAHEKIVEMLSTSIGEIRMKTMPLSMYKLLTGQEQPVYI